MINDKEIKKLKEAQEKSEFPEVFRKIKERYTDKELKIIAEGGRLMPGQGKVPIISFEGEHIRFGAMSDLHIGSIYFIEKHFHETIKQMKKERCEFLCIAGDITEGMSNRPDQVYELSHIGYTKQKDYAIDLLKTWHKPMYAIDGNHDRWFIKSSGAIIVRDICDEIKNANFLGHDEGDISLRGGAILKLWHGLDGNSYAFSYRLQKLAESLSGGEKPHIMLCGHVHKAVWIPNCRNIQMFGTGAMSKQSKWMRGKRLANHYGYWIIDVWVNKGISKCSGTWQPIYE